MDTEIKAQPERRTNDRGIAGVIKQVLDIFIGRQSRKVAFGVWLFIVATALLKAGLISSQQWMVCTYLSTLLIGFGTIVDSVLGKMGDQMAALAAKKFSAAVGDLPNADIPTPKTGE